MAIKLKLPKAKGRKRFFHLSNPVIRAAAATFIIVCVIALGVFAFYYAKYQKLIDQRMSGPVFANASKIYSIPRTISPGYKMSQAEMVAYLRKAGYTTSDERTESKLGTYRVQDGALQVLPGPESFHASEPAIIRFKGGEVERISLEGTQSNVSRYELEPELITALFEGQERSKRRIVTYDEMPKSLVDAVIAIEDRRFFKHSGINYFRLMEAAYINFRRGRYAQGGSTLTMQIARGFFLTPEKSPTRKMAEMMIAMELEQRFTKKQIFEFYANQIYLGQRGSFTIQGFGEAARAYFGKDAKELSLEESALLAAIIQRPNYFSPYRNPERALERRNIVLDGMVETGAITKDAAERAKAAKLKLTAPTVDASDAPYVVDLIKETLLTKFTEEQLNEDGLRIYSTIDPDLQKAAAEAIEVGMKEVDELVTKQRTRKKGLPPVKGPSPQVALIAMDPETGAVLAMIGGRNYGTSQLNHAVAKRPTGSIFKPFVFAAAVNSTLEGMDPAFTPATLIDDSPTTFAYEDKIYEPKNYQDKYHGPVTARFALALSLNNATVKLAEQVGYDRVVELARAAGIKSVKGTPAMALGSYDATPLDMASAYTIFASDGVRAAPMLINSVRDAKGDVVQDAKPDRKQVLDPRVAYVMTNMMEAVVNSGTAATVRGRGFSAPAAGKTGTSHDAWFAGYTSNLICIVWVGYDDYSDLKLSGGATAAPIWAEFMKRAVKLPGYGDARPFSAPDGVVVRVIDKVTNKIATATCPDDYTAAFIAGTEPMETCDQATADTRNVFQKIFGIGQKPSPPPVVSNSGQAGSSQPGTQSAQQQAQPAKEEKKEEKKGFFGKIFGVFKDDKKEEKPETKAPSKSPPPAARTTNQQ